MRHQLRARRIALAGLEHDRLVGAHVRIVVPAVRRIVRDHVVAEAPFRRAARRIEDRVAIDQIGRLDRRIGTQRQRHVLRRPRDRAPHVVLRAADHFLAFRGAFRPRFGRRFLRHVDVGHARGVRIVVLVVLAEPLGEAQDAARHHLDMVAAADALQQVGYLAGVDFGDRVEGGEVGQRARMVHQREAFAVEVGVEPARVGYFHLRGFQRHVVLLVRVGVEIGLLAGPLGIADRGAHVAGSGHQANSSVSIVGLIAS